MEIEPDLTSIKPFMPPLMTGTVLTTCFCLY